ncbi:MAG: thiamine diphosphokinase [Lachnospiraceae bacterium]|nr:thiamine diphosphokinase [Lachnospiraceae bacterium]
MNIETPMNKTGKCILVAAGDLNISDIPVGEEDCVIAVDGGLEYCQIFQITPNIIIGDYDSLSEEKKETLQFIEKTGNTEVIFLPVEKNDTDTLAALRIGLERGFTEFRIYGGMGGRLEHTLANIQSLLFLKHQNAKGYLLDGDCMIGVAKDERVEFQKSLEGYVSLFSLGESAQVSIQNMKYPLQHERITNDFPIGISNEFIGEKATITVEEGSIVWILNWA